MHVRAVVGGDIEVRADRFLGKDDARLGFEQRDVACRRSEGGKPLSDLRRIQHHVIEVMFLRASQAAPTTSLSGLPIIRPPVICSSRRPVRSSS